MWHGTGLTYGQTEKEIQRQLRIAALVTRCGSLKFFSIIFSITQGTLGNRKGRMAVA